MNLAELSIFLNEMATEMANLGYPLSSASQLSSDRTLSAYLSHVDEPEDEKTEEQQSAQPTTTQVKSFAFDSDGNLPKWVSIYYYENGQRRSYTKRNTIDFRYVSTPETTILIVYAFDFKNPKAYPKGIDQIPEIYSGIADTVIYKKNYDANDAKAFLTDLENGIENYRFCIFYEFSHGSTDCVTIGHLGVEAVVQTLAKARGRVFGIFDSCHSQSMIDNQIDRRDWYLESPKDYYKDTKIVYREGGGENWDNRGEGQMFSSPSPSEVTNIRGIIDGVEKMWKTAKPFSVPAGSSQSDQPIIMLWSSTGRSNYGWYHPGSSTVFQNGFVPSFSQNTLKRYVEPGDRTQGLWPRTQASASCNTTSKDMDYCKPCMTVFENDDGTHKFLYLFSGR